MPNSSSKHYFTKGVKTMQNKHWFNSHVMWLTACSSGEKPNEWMDWACSLGSWRKSIGNVGMRRVAFDSRKMQQQILPLQIRFETIHCHEKIHSSSTCVKLDLQTTLSRQKLRQTAYNLMGNWTILAEKKSIPHNSHNQRLLISARKMASKSWKRWLRDV